MWPPGKESDRPASRSTASASGKGRCSSAFGSWSGLIGAPYQPTPRRFGTKPPWSRTLSGSSGALLPAVPVVPRGVRSKTQAPSQPERPSKTKPAPSKAFPLPVEDISPPTGGHFPSAERTFPGRLRTFAPSVEDISRPVEGISQPGRVHFPPFRSRSRPSETFPARSKTTLGRLRTLVSPSRTFASREEPIGAAVEGKIGTSASPPPAQRGFSAPSESIAAHSRPNILPAHPTPADDRGIPHRPKTIDAALTELRTSGPGIPGAHPGDPRLPRDETGTTASCLPRPATGSLASGGRRGRQGGKGDDAGTVPPRGGRDGRKPGRSFGADAALAPHRAPVSEEAERREGGPSRGRGRTRQRRGGAPRRLRVRHALRISGAR